MRRALLVLITLFSVVFCVSQAGAEASAVTPEAVASDARLAGDSVRTRLIVDLSGSVPFRAFMLADPYRIVVDLPQIDFAAIIAAPRPGRGLVSAYRFGLIAPGKSRIVLDLAAPAVIDKSFMLDPVDGQPARLVIDLVSATPGKFREALALQTPPVQPAVPAAAPAAPGALPLVVLDPGHGGIDSGAVAGNGNVEKSIVFDFAAKLAEKIAAGGRYRVKMTRTDDSFVPLSDRVKFARDNGAALFVSIHADTLPDPFGVRGATVYTLSENASDEETARYAEKENRSDAIAGVDLMAEPDDVAGILIDLARRETKSFSNHFAQILVDEFRSAATLNKNPRRAAGFRVLRAADVPSVLLELGYLSNAQDVKLLTSDDWRDKTTDAVLRAIDGFFAAREAPVGSVEPVEALRGAN